MSLFADANYQWRETYFVLFRVPDRPTVEAVVASLNHGHNHYVIQNVQADDHGRFESLTLFSPDDCSAMDITLVTGEEVAEQVDELSKELAKSTLTDDSRRKLTRLQQCDARFDIFHFEQVVDGQGEQEECLDPGSLIIVLKRLAKLCHGVSIDPQSGTLL